MFHINASSLICVKIAKSYRLSPFSIVKAVIGLIFITSQTVLADAPPPPCEDPCSAGCPLYGHVCCTLPGSECCPTGAQGEVDCNNNNILDPCELANCIGADCDGNNVPDDCDIAQSQTLNCEYERYYYDALGRRIGKKVVNRCDRTESKTHLYYYDAQNVILETLRNSDGSETAERYFVHGNQYIDERVMMHNFASNPVDDEEYYYLEKELHSVVGLVDKTGMIVESYSYDAYGKVRIWDIVRSYGNELSKSSCGNPYFFTGRRLDFVNDTAVATPKQLYHYRARAYTPIHGRFLQRDPLLYKSGGMSLYEYVLSNPNRLTDPMGLEPISCPKGQSPRNNDREVTVNGCGDGSTLGALVPDSVAGVKFTSACNKHDKCYSDCGKSKEYCDKQLGEDMKALCEQSTALSHGDLWGDDWTITITLLSKDAQRQACYKIAELYEAAVRNLGEDAHTAAQQRYCKCCDSPEPTPPAPTPTPTPTPTPKPKKPKWPKWRIPWPYELYS